MDNDMTCWCSKFNILITKTMNYRYISIFCFQKWPVDFQFGELKLYALAKFGECKKKLNSIPGAFCQKQ